MKKLCLVLLIILPMIHIYAAAGYFEPWGKDSDLIEQPDSTIPDPRKNPMNYIAEKVILFHQNILSPVDGPRSHFRPTSSRYMLLAMRRYGFMKGFVMGCDRLLRENKEEWVYRTRTIGGIEYKWDPT